MIWHVAATILFYWHLSTHHGYLVKYCRYPGPANNIFDPNITIFGRFTLLIYIFYNNLYILIIYYLFSYSLSSDTTSAAHNRTSDRHHCATSRSGDLELQGQRWSGTGNHVVQGRCASAYSAAGCTQPPCTAACRFTVLPARRARPQGVGWRRVLVWSEQRPWQSTQ